METRIAHLDEFVYPHEENRITDRISIPELVETFVAAEADVRRSFATINAALGRLHAVGFERASLETQHSRDSMDWGDPTDVLTGLRRTIWRRLIERMQLRRAMSIAAWKELEEQVERGEPPEITIENVEGMVEQYRAEAPAMLKAAVDEVFNFLRPPRSEYKTNTEFEIGEKVVLSGYVQADWLSKWDVNSYRSQELIALENVFRMVAGQIPNADRSYYSDLQIAIEAIPRSDKCHGETEYFEFRGFKNTNLHLRFKRADLVNKLNAIAGGMRLKPA